jgi:hypothetical protein
MEKKVMGKADKPPLVMMSSPATSVDEPPADLGAPGADLWRQITSEFEVSGAGSRALLHSACLAHDRAETLRAQIDRDGPIVRTRAGPREHPGLRPEQSARSFVARTLRLLGVLDVEPTRPPGRPPGPTRF